MASYLLLSVGELRAEARTRELVSSGNRADLILRLATNDMREEYNDWSYHELQSECRARGWGAREPRSALIAKLMRWNTKEVKEVLGI